MDVKKILEELGYTLFSDREFYRAKPLYRESNNRTSLRINKNNGSFIDFSANISGSITSLIKLTLGLKSIEDAEKWMRLRSLDNLDFSSDKPEVKLEEKYDQKIVEDLLPSYHFYLKRGISEETLKLFKCGLCTYGHMVDRLVYPIFDTEMQIRGLAGRDVTNKKLNKWKLMGKKTDWCYPLFLNKKDILDKNEMILVESIGDMLALYECGIKNVICLFGIRIGREIIQQIISLDIENIIIATNNEPDNNNVGNLAAEAIKKKLSAIVDKDKVKIRLPQRKDFGELTKQEILTWHEF